MIHRYFKPDTPPYATILSDLAIALGAAGYRVSVLTCQPSYNRAFVDRAAGREEFAENVVVRRFGVLPDRRFAVLKVANLALFALRILLAGPRLGKVDAVMAASTPPVGIARVGLIFAQSKRARFIYHHQDIYPEIIDTGGPGRSFSKILRRVDSGTDRRADRVVVLSSDMVSTIEERVVEPESIAVINNFDPWYLDESASFASVLGPLEIDRSKDGSVAPLVVAYTGNLGRFQGLEVVFEALVGLRDAPIEFHFIGDGPLRQELERLVLMHRLSRVHVYGYLPPDRVAAFLRDRAHVGLVSLRQGVIRAAYPSKTMSYLRNGVPILAVAESTSELATVLARVEAGWVSDSTRTSSLEETLRSIVANPGQLRGAGDRALALYQKEFSPQVALERWRALFVDLIGGPQ